MDKGGDSRETGLWLGGTEKLAGGHQLRRSFVNGVFIGGKHLHHTFKPMTNNELTLDQLQTIAGGGVFAKLDSFKTNFERKASPSMVDVVLGPLGGEGVFLGPLSAVKEFLKLNPLI